MGEVSVSAVQIRRLARRFEDVGGSVDRAGTVVDGGWRALSASAWSSRARKVARQTRAVNGPLEVVAAALARYAESVERIAVRERSIVDDLAGARTKLGGAQEDLDALEVAGDWESPVWWDARAAVRNAEDRVDDLEVQLKRLASSREQADVDAVTAIRRATPSGWDMMHRMLGGVPFAGLALDVDRPAPAGRFPDFTAMSGDAVRFIVKDLDTAELEAFLDDNPGLALLLMRRADLSRHPRFSAIYDLSVARSDPDRARAVAAAWEGMSAADRDELVRLYPWLVGNLDGLPLHVRARANRTAIRAELHGARREESVMIGQSAWEWENGGPDRVRAVERFTDHGYTDWEQVTRSTGWRGSYDEVLAELRVDIASYERWLNATTLTMVDGREVTRPAHQVVLFDPASGQFAEVSGTVGENTANLGVLVGGTGSNMRNTESMRLRAESFTQESRGRLAVITYLGGEMPQSLPDAAASRNAKEIGPRLADLVAGLDVVTDAPIAVAGHSYGGSVVGAAEAAGMRADRVLHIASAGAGPGVKEVGQYADPTTPRYSMTAPGDPIGRIQGLDLGSLGHGADPDELHAVSLLETGRINHADPTSRSLEGPDAHSEVFTQGSTAWENIYRFFTAGDVIEISDGN